MLREAVAVMAGSLETQARIAHVQLPPVELCVLTPCRDALSWSRESHVVVDPEAD
jgi:hypothetical protein